MSRTHTQFLFSFLLLFALLVSLLGHAPARVEAAGVPVVDPALRAALATATGPLEVIVTFHGDKAPGDAELALLRGLGIQQGLTMRSLPIAGVLATAEQVNALAARPEVRSLWLNEALTYDNFDARALTGVDRVRTDATLTLRNGGLPVGGQGITVLVNDSGAEGLHADLAPNIIQNTSGATNLHGLVNVVPVTYLEGVPHTDIAGGHGTHVAGIVAGTGAKSAGRYEGVAPGAKLVVYGSGAGLLLLDTLGGFDYALTHQFRYGIRVVTNSWGSTSDMTDFNPDHPTNVATKLLTERNIVVVFSAGNSGPNAGTITGNYKKAPWVITVAAGDKNRQLASFSSRGTAGKDRPTLTAPGVDIISTRALLGAPLGTTSDLGVEPAYLPYYTTLSGTSMAAPHVAGIVALMLDANPKLTPAQVKQILEDTATLMPGYESWEVGAGYADAYKAVRRAFGMTVTDEPNNLDIIATPTPTPAPTATPAPAPTGESQVIVSVIDSAMNPYHEFFNAGGEPYQSSAPASVTPALLAALGIDSSHVLKLTRTGNFSADYAADAALWSRVKPGELYWFEGTNVLAISFDPGTRPILPDDSGDTHGVGTTAAVLRANPEAVILFVEGITDQAEAYAFNHPLVDIITTSYGPIGSIPSGHIHQSYQGVVGNGKLHFGAADNSPSPAVQDGTAGPWWSIGIAGFEEGTSEGRQILSGSLPDFVSDFTQELPYCHDCETGLKTGVAGTSFATPRSAGTASRLLLEARRLLGHSGGITRVGDVPVLASGQGRSITNWQLRRALEEAAYYPTVYDYDPIEGLFDISAPVLDPTPWSQVGWGVITPDSEHAVVSEALAQLGLSGTTTRSKDTMACQYMTSLVQARHLYWDEILILSDSWWTTADPYVYCER